MAKKINFSKIILDAGDIYFSNLFYANIRFEDLNNM
jgi:hypothetical protein